MLAKRFFYVCAGLLCLALAYHLGARSATAQAPGNPIAAAPATGYVFTANGDLYYSPDPPTQPYSFLRNVFSGATPAAHETWGGVKARYRQPATVAPKDK